MAEILTYDPSNDPQAIQHAEERDAETLAIGEQMEADQEQMLAGKYRNAQELEKAYLELQKNLATVKKPKARMLSIQMLTKNHLKIL